jgi:hypothetical protein
MTSPTVIAVSTERSSSLQHNVFTVVNMCVVLLPRATLVIPALEANVLLALRGA